MKPHRWIFVKDGFMGTFVYVTNWRCMDCGSDGRSWRQGGDVGAIDLATASPLSPDCLLVVASKVMEK